MNFAAAQANFLAAARYGMDAQLDWPGLGEVTTRELVLGTLLPMAHEDCGGGVSTRRYATGSWVSSAVAPRPAATARAGRSPPWRPYKTAG